MGCKCGTGASIEEDGLCLLGTAEKHRAARSQSWDGVSTLAVGFAGAVAIFLQNKNLSFLSISLPSYLISLYIGGTASSLPPSLPLLFSFLLISFLFSFLFFSLFSLFFSFFSLSFLFFILAAQSSVCLTFTLAALSRHQSGSVDSS